jgi:galactose mutarotase-like enzyme
MASIALEGESWQAAWLPEVGGKMTSFRSKAGGFEYLWQPPSGEYPRPAYGIAYDAEYATGFDECFPTILPCSYPDGPWRGTSVPEHGEVWALPRQWQRGHDHYDLAVEGRALPYRFAKKVSVAGEAVLFEYTLENRGGDVLHYLWSAHPLFNLRPDTILEIEGAPELVIGDSPDGQLGPVGSRGAWPLAGGMDLSWPGGRPKAADKVFITGLRAGRVAIRHRELGEGVRIEWDAEQAPYLGLWYNLRGWPESAPQYSLGIEPCTTASDVLTDSAAWLAAGTTAKWWMRWTIEG